MNFRTEFARGLEGKNEGLSFGLPALDIELGGVQKRAIYGICAGPKVGKTTFTDYSFVISPYLDYLELKKDPKYATLEIEWIYFSFEISRIKKEFKLVPYFLLKDHGIATFRHKSEVRDISPQYLEGKLKDKDGERIIPCDEHIEAIMKVYEERIIPLFGEYDEEGNLIKPGFIRFVENKENPTGLRNYIGRYSADNGRWVMRTENVGSSEKPEYREYRSHWVPNNPDKYTIIITDHLRKLLPERGMQKKEVVDKYIEYQVEFRNWCGFTFVDIIHLNRNMSDVNRLKYNNEFLYPTGDDIKDTGNLSEEADYIITLMNPNDEKYGLSKHFGLQIKDTSNDETYPGYTSIHLVESRDTECPVHFRSIMQGNLNNFTELEESLY